MKKKRPCLWGAINHFTTDFKCWFNLNLVKALFCLGVLVPLTWGQLLFSCPEKCMTITVPAAHYISHCSLTVKGVLELENQRPFYLRSDLGQTSGVLWDWCGSELLLRILGLTWPIITSQVTEGLMWSISTSQVPWVFCGLSLLPRVLGKLSNDQRFSRGPAQSKDQ